MRRMRLSDAEVISAIYDAALDADAWEHALTCIAGQVGATGAMLVHNAPLAHRGWIIPARLRPDLSELYMRDYVLNDYAAAFGLRPPGRVLVANSVVDRSQVGRTAFHADILAPQGIAEMLTVRHDSFSRSGYAGGVTLTLDAAQAEDTAEAVRRFEALLPHLMRAIDLSSELHERIETLDQLADAIGGALLFLDETLKVVRANARGEDILRRADGLSTLDGGRLVASDPAEQGRLAAMLAAAQLATKLGHRGDPAALRLRRPSGRRDMLVMAVPLAPRLSHREPAARVRILLRIIESDLPARSQARLLGRIYGLTPAETRVASLVGAGLSLPQAAASLALSVNTVRTHAQRCYGKTGLRSQAEFVRLMASLPADGADLAGDD